MPKLRIDDQEVSVPEGSTVLDAARQAQIPIPTLCHLKGVAPQTSCLICIVQIGDSPRLVPSCATRAAEGMVVHSSTDFVRAARKTALALLLAEHAGECFAPCSQVCPAHLSIPDMMQQVRGGNLSAAIATARDALVLPATLGYICPGLCEKGCRRTSTGGAVSICATHKFLAETDLASGDPWLPTCAPATGNRVAVIGAGPAGLAAAYELVKTGHRCLVIDSHPAAGGTLRYGLEPGKLPADVLDAEIELLTRLGVTWQMNTHLGRDISLGDLRRQHQAIAITQSAGPSPDFDNVFTSASAASAPPHAVQAVADGKQLARDVIAFLAGHSPSPRRRFAVRLGAYSEAEMRLAMAAADPRPRTEALTTFTADTATLESERCMLCGCMSTDICKLRKYAAEYGAEPSRYRGQRRPISTNTTHPDVVFEEGKCISCGLCVAIARKAGEPMGLSFVGRGFTITVAAPLDNDWSRALTRVAGEAIAACPTGAIHRPRP